MSKFYRYFCDFVALAYPERAGQSFEDFDGKSLEFEPAQRAYDVLVERARSPETARFEAAAKLARKYAASEFGFWGGGKFSTRMDEILYRITMDGFDAELGDAESFGYYALVRNSRNDSILAWLFDHEDELHSVGLWPSWDELKHHVFNAGFILREDSQGFVYVEGYETKQELDAAWSRLENEYTLFLNDVHGDGEG